jgi:hypothetical protein
MGAGEEATNSDKSADIEHAEPTGAALSFAERARPGCRSRFCRSALQVFWLALSQTVPLLARE